MKPLTIALFAVVTVACSPRPAPLPDLTAAEATQIINSHREALEVGVDVQGISMTTPSEAIVRTCFGDGCSWKSADPARALFLKLHFRRYTDGWQWETVETDDGSRTFPAHKFLSELSLQAYYARTR